MPGVRRQKSDRVQLSNVNSVNIAIVAKFHLDQIGDRNDDNRDAVNWMDSRAGWRDRLLISRVAWAIFRKYSANGFTIDVIVAIR
jgi:hypothetical protein